MLCEILLDTFSCRNFILLSLYHSLFDTGTVLFYLVRHLALGRIYEEEEHQSTIFICSLFTKRDW